MPPPVDSAPAPRWSLSESVAAGAAAFALIASLAVLPHPWYDAKNDAAVYIASARSLVAGEGYRYLGDPVHVRPPGFSVLIAPFVGDELDFEVLNRYVAAWGAVGIALVFLYWRTRMPWSLALLCSAALWLNPAFQRFASQTMSDVPAVTLLMACLLLERWADRIPSPVRDATLGVAIGLASLVRTSNLLLLPAIVVARWLTHRSDRRAPEASGESRFWTRRMALLTLAVLLVQIPWALRNQLEPAPIPADQTLPYSYLTGLLHEDKADPGSRRLSVGEVLERIPDQSHRMLVGLGTRLAHDRGEPTDYWLAIPLLAAFLVAWARRRGSVEWFVAASLATVAVYFGYQNRLLLPAFVLLLPIGVETLHGALRRVVSEPIAIAIPAVALAVWIAVDLPPQAHWPEVEKQHQRWERVATALRRELPTDACVASAWGFQYGLYLDRPVYSLQPSLWRGGADALERTLERYAIDTVVLVPARQPEGELLPYFEQRYGQPRRVGAARVFQVRPTRSGCKLGPHARDAHDGR